ncbi:MAG: hypothetical protein EPN75_11435 [Beijerinckiaceae bacterium]|nr:MAG: hypothetical protein EPN75_11435 [Beijerinckiaceae bacterium]
MNVETRTTHASERIIDADGAQIDVFELPTDSMSLESLLSDLFENHWREIVFGPIIQGAVFEWRAQQAPTRIGMFDGYLTVAFGVPHFHLCIGEHKGMPSHPVASALAHHRRTSRAELFRRVCKAGTPVSWGLRLFNGRGEQQITILLPNPFLNPDTDKILKAPDWSRLELWDQLRARWFGLDAPDPFDRSGKGFRHE